MKIKKVANKLTPLCFLPCGRLICYKNGNLFIQENKQIVEKHPILISFREKWLARSKAMFRLLRIGIRTAIAIDDRYIIISVRNMIYEYDLIERKLSKGFSLPIGVRPLAFTQINNIDSFQNSIVFGGYLNNKEKKPVNIYRRKEIDHWEIVYTFKQGDINHVHNIVSDPYRQCLWAFTGDFGSAAAIWKISANYKRVEKILSNDQKYRGCIIFPIKEGLLYATDSPFAPNFIYLLKINSDNGINSFKLESLNSIKGSCIYGCQCGSKYIFSSSVEPDGKHNNLLNLLFSRKKGAGITDMNVHMYVGNCEEGFFDIYNEKKDLLPYLFQFGTIRFPHGTNKSHYLYFQPVATNKNDLNLLYIDI